MRASEVGCVVEAAGKVAVLGHGEARTGGSVLFGFACERSLPMTKCWDRTGGIRWAITRDGFKSNGLGKEIIDRTYPDGTTDEHARIDKAVVCSITV